MVLGKRVWILSFIISLMMAMLHVQNRDHLFAPTTRCCGISVADHELYGSACVMNFAEHFVEGHLLENLNEDSDDQVELGLSVHLRN